MYCYSISLSVNFCQTCEDVGISFHNFLSYGDRQGNIGKKGIRFNTFVKFMETDRETSERYQVSHFRQTYRDRQGNIKKITGFTLSSKLWRLTGKHWKGVTSPLVTELPEANIGELFERFRLFSLSLPLHSLNQCVILACHILQLKRRVTDKPDFTFYARKGFMGTLLHHYFALSISSVQADSPRLSYLYVFCEQ